MAKLVIGQVDRSSATNEGLSKKVIPQAPHFKNKRHEPVQALRMGLNSLFVV